MAQPMPTGAKLMAAACFAVVGWLITNFYVPNMPDKEAAGLIREWAALLGAVVGWRVMGPAAGKGYVEAAGSGIKTVVVFVFFGLLFFALRQMLGDAFKMRYDGAVDAILSVPQIMAERSVALLSVGVIAAMLIGGVVAGLLTENASRRWR